jgi:hypothetical protein
MLYRQGDVLLIKVNSIPNNLKEAEPESGRYILARGEATGHHHSVETGPALMFVCPEESILYLDVVRPVELVHQEHAAILIEPGQYQVVRQREYMPSEVRYVAD